MKFQSHIPKPHIPRKFLLLAMGVFMALPILFMNSLTVHASSDYSAIVDRIVGAIYNGTHDDTRGGDSHIVNGVAYTRTGYLCYLLTKDGSPTGLPAYAFQSPGFNGIAGSKWVCTSRRGQSVSGWSGDAPWGVTPWGNGGSPSYEPDIRDWMLQPINGKPQAQQFVLDCWGVEAEKNFQSDNYILVLETIMNFQYSTKSGSGNEDVIYVSRGYIESAANREAEAIVNSRPDMSPENREKLRAQVVSAIMREVIDRLKSNPKVVITEGGNAGSNRTFTSPPLIGTVPNLITYKNGNTVFDSYTNKVAPHSEKIKVNEAGFTAYTGTGSGPLSDSEVQSYGVAMLIIHCKSDAIHTYWEPHGSPGNPEPRIPGKTGTCNIVKGYYKENLTTGAKQSLGRFYELDVTSNIIVSGEPNFELVEWRVTTATSTTVNPIAWNPPGTPTQQGKTGATLSLKDPEDCVYVLLF